MVFPPHIIKCFLLKIQGFSTFHISVNKPQSRIFRYIRYWNRGLQGTRNKTSSFLLYMALCIPIPLWQLTSYVHQDHLCLQRSSLPSFCLSITRVSALLPYGVMPHGDNHGWLLAHSLYFWLLTCFLYQHCCQRTLSVTFCSVQWLPTRQPPAGFPFSAYAACMYASGRLISPSIFAGSYSTPFVSMA